MDGTVYHEKNSRVDAVQGRAAFIPQGSQHDARDVIALVLQGAAHRRVGEDRDVVFVARHGGAVHACAWGSARAV